MLGWMPRIAKKSGAYHHGDLRRVLLETAVRVLEHEGLSALSLQALSKRAGVSSGAPYHHFESREQLLMAIAGQGFELLAQEMRRCASLAGADAASELRGLGEGYMRFALAHRGHFRVMFRPELHEHLPDSCELPSEDAFGMLHACVLRCQAEKLARAGDPMPLVLVAWAGVHGASTLWIDGSLEGKRLVPNESVLIEMVARTLVELIIRPR
jgi:AcrR family transcriptional regulator